MDIALPVSDDRRTACIAVLAAAVGTLSGLVLLERGPVQGLAILAMPALAFAMLRSLWIAFAGVIAVVCVLPYGVLPAGTSVTPTLLEGALLTALGLTVAVTLIDRRLELTVDLPQVLVVLLVGFTIFAFILGLGRRYSTQTAHDFFKFMLGIATFWLTIHLIRTGGDSRRVTRLVVSGVGLSAIAGLVLYAGGVALTERVLTRLTPFGYPGSRIARFIEDDPAQAMRAVGTSVDPNSYGGLLMVGFVLAVGQLVVRRRALPVWMAMTACAVIGPTLALTYSRGAWLGVVAGLLVIVAFRRPWLLMPGALVAVATVAAGLGSGFVERLWLGFTLQDPATKLRLSEYDNAWRIIQQHPWFGVGFGDAGSIELQTGVSSTYLTIAERAGLVGLTIFLLTVSVILLRGLRASTRKKRDEISDTVLCWTAALVAALTVGVFDHYFFNPPFAHMATLFWLVAGVVTRLSLPFDNVARTSRNTTGALSFAQTVTRRQRRSPYQFKQQTGRN